MAIEPAKAQLICLEDSSLKLEFKYNPKEFTIKRQGGFTGKDKAPGSWGGLTWSCAKPDELSFDVVLDVSEPDLGLESNLALLMPISSSAALAGMLDTTSVLDDISMLHKMTFPRQGDSGPNHIRPPFSAFIWGDFQFFGGLQDITSKIILFDIGGIPKRAEVSISMIGQAMHAPANAEELAGYMPDHKYDPLSSYSDSSAKTTDIRVSLLSV